MAHWVPAVDRLNMNKWMNEWVFIVNTKHAQQTKVLRIIDILIPNC